MDDTDFYVPEEKFDRVVLILMAQFVPNFYYPVFKQLRILSYQAIID
jgi:hypothetical protein